MDQSISSARKPNFASAVVFGLIIIFIIGTRSLVRLRIAALGQDPCDAVRVFAAISIVVTAVGSLIRLFRQKHRDVAPALHRLYVMRSQQSVIFAIFLTLAADIVALARHPPIRTSAASRDQFIVWLSVLTVCTFASQVLILARREDVPRWSGVNRAGLAVAGVIAVLAICPEWPIDYSSNTAHILTVVLGGLVLFVSMRFLLVELIPSKPDEPSGNAVITTAREWGFVFSGGLLFGLAFLLETMHYRLPVPFSPVVLGVAGAALIAYAFLSEPLGFS